MIQGNGSPYPPAFLISDVAFGDDSVTNKAISGYQYNFFQMQFRNEANLKIENFWRTLLIKQAVPEYDRKVKRKADKIAQETIFNNLIGQYGPLLIEEINELKPNLIIPTGELTFNFLTGLRGIRKFRGSVLPATLPGLIKNTKVLPILGPYPFINNDFKLRMITRVDCSKIPKHLDDSPVPDNLYNIWIAKSSTALREFFERSYKKCMSSEGPKYVVFDIETFCGVPTCASFCFDGFESVCVPFLDPSIDLDNRVLMIDLIAKLLDDKKIGKVNQNIKYDWKRFENWGFRIANICGDTMLAASCLYCEYPKNLGFLTSIYTDLPYFKDEGRDFDPTKHKKEQYYLYNAKDSLATHQIYRQQIGELVEKGVSDVYEHTIKLMPIYKKMEERGLRVDGSAREDLLIKYKNLFELQEKKLNLLVNSDTSNKVNSLSHKQMRYLVYEVLGYKKIRGVATTQAGEPGTDEDSLMQLLYFGEAIHAPSTGPQVLNNIINCRKIDKVLQILEMFEYPDKRFRCEYNLAGTENGRTSAGTSTDELFYFDEKGEVKKKNLGRSLQTIGKHGFQIDGITYGKDIRKIFIPSYGYIFVEIDLSQAEARVDTVLANNISLLSVFDDPNVGIHRLTGSWCFDCRPDEIIKNTLRDGIDRYHVAKQVRHAGERNIREDGLVTKLLWGLTPQQGKTLLVKFHKYQPEIREVFHREIRNIIDKNLPLVAPNGRLREFFDRVSEQTYNEGYSFLPQAIVSDQTKFCGILPTFSDPRFTKNAELLNEQHDGILAEIKIGHEEAFVETYIKNVTKPIDFRKCSLARDFELVIPAEASYSEETWYSM